MKEAQKSRQHRSVLRHQKNHEFISPGSYPLNPVMDIAVFNKLQEIVFGPYQESLDMFISEIAPYYKIPFSYKSVMEKENPKLEIDQVEGNWFSILFQQLVIVFASLNDEEVSEARDYFHRLVDHEHKLMNDYDSAETKSIIYKFFKQTLYLNGLIDELNQFAKIPSYRYRTKSGFILSYAPSLPLQSLSSIICDRFEIASEGDIRLIENFCVFYWNLRRTDSELKYEQYLESYIQKAAPKLVQGAGETEKVLLLDEICEYIDFVLSDEFNEADPNEEI